MNFKYRTLFENAIEGIFQTTPEGKCITANPALARMHGYDSAEDFVTTFSGADEALKRFMETRKIGPVGQDFVMRKVLWRDLNRRYIEKTRARYGSL